MFLNISSNMPWIAYILSLRLFVIQIRNMSGKYKDYDVNKLGLWSKKIPHFRLDHCNKLPETYTVGQLTNTQVADHQKYVNLEKKSLSQDLLWISKALLHDDNLKGFLTICPAPINITLQQGKVQTYSFQHRSNVD